MRKVAVSGGFDPVHTGHLQMFEEAKKLGDYLIVILNGDEWLREKKGYVFMSALQRAAIIGALKPVDEVYILDSERDDVVEALEKLKPDVFANGGDRKSDNTPEVQFCDDHGIQLAWGVGGEKFVSSSELVSRAIMNAGFQQRPWGEFKLHDEGIGWALKTLFLAPGEMTSLQSHKKRIEHWMLVEGEASVSVGDMTYPLTPFNSVRVEIGTKHRLVGGPDGAFIVEIMQGDYDEEDITRYEDKYNRI